MKEMYLKVGKKGEIYTSKEIRNLVGIKPSGYVIAKISEGKLIIEPLERAEDIIKKPKKIQLTVEEFEKLSMEVQREMLEP
ncbi:MAG: hypothetical protein DRJ32_02485 [Thermoprotei archaeon]|nr:MAG: hypothetical protein B6U94_06345 [Thermofilum sp. ex4484_79]RLE60693.1 MAG: hypothetical protein DRJ32_02485 [Thermoprotei archaeon]HDD64152.1 hypothetical protein [Thermoprotei archaeon]